MRFLWGLGLRSESRQFIAVCSADPHPAPCVDGELSVAEVVEWQTRTFEGRVAQAVRVQVPPSAPNSTFVNGHLTTAACSGNGCSAFLQPGPFSLRPSIEFTFDPPCEYL